MANSVEVSREDLERQSDVLALLSEAGATERQDLRDKLRGKILTLTGTSSFKFWIGVANREVIYPDHEIFEFNSAQVQVLDVLFGTDYSGSPTDQSFGLIVEAAENYDSQILPRLVMSQDIQDLVDTFPAGFDDEDVSRVVESAKDIFSRLAANPDFDH